MLLHTSFKLNSVIAVKVKHTLLYIELYEESVVFGIAVFQASMLDLGGPSDNVGSPAKFCVEAFKAYLLYTGGIHWPKKVCLPDLSSQMFRCGHHRGLFVLHTKDQ